LKEHKVKIAVITDDGKTISKHFGRARYYQVVSIEEGKVKNRELREKIGHGQFSSTGVEEHDHEHHGSDEAAHGKHSLMAQAITDCEAVICGGMGLGAYDSLRRLNIRPYVTDKVEIDSAVQAYIDGELADHTELLH
jgi:predicted Fe-Mo cluster-binding NifX family protein